MKPATEPGPPLAEHTWRELRKAILRCDYAPGERLRVEELAQRFGVSSSPVREALNRLAQQGLVVMVENRGFRVVPLTSAGVADLVRVRLLVEQQALSDAIAHGDDAWEAGVVSAAHALALAERRLGTEPRALDDEWSVRHRAFHLSLYSGCMSPLLLELVNQLFDRAEHYRRWSARHRQAPRAKHDEHQKLRDAVLARDEQRALDLIGRHIGRTGELVAAVLDGAPPQWKQ